MKEEVGRVWDRGGGELKERREGNHDQCISHQTHLVFWNYTRCIWGGVGEDFRLLELRIFLVQDFAVTIFNETLLPFKCLDREMLAHWVCVVRTVLRAWRDRQDLWEKQVAPAHLVRRWATTLIKLHVYTFLGTLRLWSSLLSTGQIGCARPARLPWPPGA